EAIKIPTGTNRTRNGLMVDRERVDLPRIAKSTILHASSCNFVFFVSSWLRAPLGGLGVLGGSFLRRLARNRGAVVGGVLVLAITLMAVFAPVVAPYRPDEQSFADYLTGPSARHWFGTDEQGRDLLSRVIFGSQISLRVGIIAVTISAIAGLC